MAQSNKIYGLESDKIKSLAQSYINNKSSVDEHWQKFFEQVDIASLISIKQENKAKQPCKNCNVKFTAFTLENLTALPKEEQNFIQQIVDDFRMLDEDKNQAFADLSKAVLFEEFLSKKFIGVKRFSIEGLESTVVMLNKIKSLGFDYNLSNLNIAMAHRGRLNVLANVMNKPYYKIIAGFLGFDEFGGELEGDVKYHLGLKTNFVKNDKVLHGKLFNNPSHLEAANSVAMGYTYAQQEKLGINNVLPVILHGDSAFAGQGSVAETLNMAYVDGYNIGGTVHIIQNNQIGFTAEPNEATSIYCTNIAKSLDAPIIHVSAENIEDVVKAAEIAFMYRQKFNKDIFIDLIGFRKYGHNEGDDPNFTNAEFYSTLKSKKSMYKNYKDELLAENFLSQQQAKKIEDKFLDLLAAEYKKAEEYANNQTSKYELTSEDKKVKVTNFKENIDEDFIAKCANKMQLPLPNFNLNKKLAKILENRRESLLNKTASDIDWGTAENLAYANLVNQGISVRLAGQDSKRGTFSHRHLALVDQENSESLILWNSLAKDNAKISVYNSPVSEYACLGFEYGYNMCKVENQEQNLTIWEAQFGDFANGAQIMFDQFVFSAKQKWNEENNLTIILPHGFEGQGPEHSSARIERFLSLAGQNNMLIANPSSSEQMFHLLQHQAKANKPLVMFSPKSLLRRKEANTNIANLTNGEFKTIKDENTAKKARKLVFCSGKLYHDLMQEKQNLADKTTAIVAIEQLYPLPIENLEKVLDKFKGADVIWAQEEPRNAGAFLYMQDKFLNNFDIKITYAGIAEKASPAVGNLQLHKKQQNFILQQVFAK